jgi:uncharacterized membrane protein
MIRDSTPLPPVKSALASDGAANPRPPLGAGEGGHALAPKRGTTWTRIRNRLIEGLLVALPVFVTFWIIHWLYSWLESYVIEPLAVLVLWKVRNLRSAPELPPWFERYAAPLIAVAIALGILYCCGVLAHSSLRRMMEQALLRVPVVAPIYDAVRNVLKCLEAPGDKPTPQRVVLVSFPHPGMRLPAIVTSTCRDVATGKTLLCVYVPTTPVPTSGFFLMVPEEEATELNWDIQQTLQAIISGGLTAPPNVSYYRPATVPGIPPDATRRGGEPAPASGRASD